MYSAHGNSSYISYYSFSSSYPTLEGPSSKSSLFKAMYMVIFLMKRSQQYSLEKRA